LFAADRWRFSFWVFRVLGFGILAFVFDLFVWGGSAWAGRAGGFGIIVVQFIHVCTVRKGGFWKTVGIRVIRWDRLDAVLVPSCGVGDALKMVGKPPICGNSFSETPYCI